MTPSSLPTVGIVGFGVMGAGLVQVFAEAGWSVVVVDVDDKSIAAGRKALKSNLRLRRLLRSDKDAARPLADVGDRVMTTTDLSTLRSASFVIESATESWTLKRDLLVNVDRLCERDTVIASNTSAIPITKLASVMARPTHVIGTHFMNPPYLKDTVEVIRGFHTSDETVEATVSMLHSIGKQCVVVRDAPGFVSNRVLMLTLNEAMFVVHEQTATPSDVDRIFRECMGQTMGPLATADLIGLDTVFASLEVLYHEFCDPKFRPCPLLSKMVAAGLYGRKSGRGFYSY